MSEIPKRQRFHHLRIPPARLGELDGSQLCQRKRLLAQKLSEFEQELEELPENEQQSLLYLLYAEIIDTVRYAQFQLLAQAARNRVEALKNQSDIITWEKEWREKLQQLRNELETA